MSNCTGPDCTHSLHRRSRQIAASEPDVAGGEAGGSVDAPSASPAPGRNPRNTIVRRAVSATGKWYLRMGDGSIIKPQTAIKRGLVTQADIDRALAEEKAMKDAPKVKPPKFILDQLMKGSTK